MSPFMYYIVQQIPQVIGCPSVAKGFFTLISKFLGVGPNFHDFNEIESKQTNHVLHRPLYLRLTPPYVLERVESGSKG